MDVVTQVLAGYGALLSTALAVQQWRDRQPHIRVRPLLARMRLAPAPGFIDDQSTPTVVVLRLQNVGRRVVMLDAVGFVLPDGRHFGFDQARRDVDFPYSVPAGQSCTTYWPITDFARRLADHGFTGKIRLIGYCMDVADHTFRSKPFEFDVDAWAAKATP